MIITMICTDSFDLFVARYTSIKTRPSIQRFCETWFLHVVTRQKKKKRQKSTKRNWTALKCEQIETTAFDLTQTISH